ncbi:putative cycloartenol synthase [Medicago truncatula]|uniref:Putative cycloartenol synthase n=1 Tax=Medicago truncatula TaxID=3880 RepID=A0A396HHZ7_MEDTR|nr:putative cycloartenol synthase [Medicago truncatula]
MWKLKFSKNKDGTEELVRSVNKNIGRQFWEYDPNLGTEQKRAQVEQARKQFHENRFKTKNSSDLLMRLQGKRFFKYEIRE